MEDEIKEKLKAILETYPEVKLAYFFGSRSTGQAGPMSDYDFAVYLDERDSKKIFNVKAVLLDKISLLLGTDNIDIVVLDTAEKPELKFSIISEGEIIVDREPYRLMVEPKIMNEYFDFHAMLLRHNMTRA